MSLIQETSALVFENDENESTNAEFPSQFLKDALKGLSSTPKYLQPKYFYDAEGSKIFEQICKLDDYYVTRTENSIFEKYSDQIASFIPENSNIIEPGSGASRKIRHLLRHAKSTWSYIPFEISKEILNESAAQLALDYLNVAILPIHGDFTQGFENVTNRIGPKQNRIVFFPGSTLGNFDSLSAFSFLTQARKFVGGTGKLIIGVDLIKDRQVLETAYNDSHGVTAAFNLNLLKRLNVELGADFDLSQFRHAAHFNENESRIEMHLRALKDCEVTIQKQKITFKKGETIHTENSYKYSVDLFSQFLEKAGFKLEKLFTDEKSYFGIFVCKAIEKPIERKI